MLYSVRGTLIHMEPNIAVVECGGVGFKCRTTVTSQRNIKLNTEVTLYTYMNVREDAIELFGFATLGELTMFKTLTTVSGVGPKVGIAILSVLSPDQITMAIATDDTKTLTRSNGVGNKLAQRIILELKDKLKGLSFSDNSSLTAGTNVSGDFTLANTAKAVEALSVLGYSSSDVTPVLAQLDSTLPVEQLISETLKRMGRK